jgi:hypothetical protein
MTRPRAIDGDVCQITVAAARPWRVKPDTLSLIPNPLLHMLM